MEAIAIVGAGAAGDVILYQARAIGQRRGEFERNRNGRIDAGSRNGVVVERQIVIERVADDRGTGTGEHFRKVTVAEGRGGHVADLGGSAAAPEAFPTGEPEHFVAQFRNGAADRDAELILRERYFRQSVAIGKELVGVELLIAQIFVGRAVQLVGAGLDDHRDIGAH